MNDFKRPSALIGFASLLLLMSGGIYSVVTAAGNTISPNNIEPVALAADPLYSQGAGQKPTLTLALSVEFPTVGAQYRDSFDAAKEYVGYFDTKSCYSYSKDSQYFERTGAAASMKCGGNGFSGNFMNWAASSSIDILRYGLTGGDRVTDTGNLTVLQRAVLQTSFWNSGAYFPQKSVSNAVAAQVLPSTLLGNYKSTIYISNCLNNIFFANNTSTGSCASPTAANSLGAKIGNTNPASGSTALSTGMFLTRVKVCEATDPRTNLCQKYPAGNLKPVGNMQKYSDRVRLAAFGYLNDSGNQRYGGVLRAPMTFVGAKSYDADGNVLAGTNANMEWNADTGVFVDNPRNAAEGASGVINYLNKFGRTGAFGQYKSNDPVGELYYESLRYLQGLQPTSQAVSGLNDAMKDGYPVYTAWTDPFENNIDGNRASEKNYACLRNSIVLIGDVNTHNDKSLPGNTRTSNYDFNRAGEVSLSNNIPNFVDWTNVLGGFESGGSVSYLDGDGNTRTTSNPTSIKNTGLSNMATVDTGSNGAAYYIAGAAYWAHTHDIRGADWSEAAKRRPGMRVTTYVLDVNENSSDSDWNTRKNKQFYLAAKYGGFDDLSGVGNPYTPANSNGVFDNRQWAKVAGSTQPDPKTYFLASDAQAVLDALDNIFIAATKVTNSIASPASSSNKLSAVNGYYYLASFDPEYWSGDVKRNTISTDGASVIQGDQTALVSAAAKLDLKNPTQRNIIVGKASGLTSGLATSFTWSNIETSLQDNLNNVSTALPQGDSQGQNRLNFIRGDRSLEATSFRQRSSRMGDIINSGIVYSGVPSGRYSGTTYSNFFNANKNRTAAVFVGANDGMLHAFDATTMEELFAYIPSWIAPKLKTLTKTDYNSSLHSSYVDATPMIAEAEVGSAWKTVLVSGTGGGGQGVFALDVSNPSAFASEKVIWEFTDRDDADLGNVMGTIQVVKMRVNAKTDNPASYKWFAVVPSGVNNYVADGYQSTTGKPALFFLDLSKDASSAWSLGTNYFKVSFPFLSTQDTGTALIDSAEQLTGKTRATGLINFEAVAAPDGSVRYFYVPDLHGQLWKLDMLEANLSDAQASSWNLQKLGVHRDASDNPVPMFQAQTKAGKAQPISMTPTIAYGPTGSYIVAFGTGKYLEAKDNAISGTTLKQSFYALYDVNDKTSFDTSGKGRLKLQRGTASGANITVPAFIWKKPAEAVLADSSTEDPVTNAQKAGWYMDFPYGGSVRAEQQVSNAALFGKKIIFNSIMPPSASTSACSGGSSYTYSPDLATGSGTVSPLINSAQGSPLIFTVKSDVSNSNSVGQRTQKDTIVLMSPSSTGDGKLQAGEQLTNTGLVGRLSWRQINNYRDLKNKSWE